MNLNILIYVHIIPNNILEWKIKLYNLVNP